MAISDKDSHWLSRAFVTLFKVIQMIPTPTSKPDFSYCHGLVAALFIVFSLLRVRPNRFGQLRHEIVLQHFSRGFQGLASTHLGLFCRRSCRLSDSGYYF